jgi:hypothetical protein
MYVLVHTPTSPGTSAETATFADLEALWEHVKALKGYVEPPTSDAESLGLSTENRYLKGILVDVYMRLDKEFRSLREGEQSKENIFLTTFLGASPFNQGTTKVPSQELRGEPFACELGLNQITSEIEEDIDWQKEKEKIKEKIKETQTYIKAPTVVEKQGTLLTELSGNQVEYDPTETRVAYMNDIFKPDYLPKISVQDSIDLQSSDARELYIERVNQEERMTKIDYNSAKVDIFQKLFIDNFTKKTEGYNPHYKTTFFCWVLFASTPKTFLKKKGVEFPLGLQDVLAYDKQKLYNSFENICHRHVLKLEDDDVFLTYRHILEYLIPKNREKLEFKKQRSWESICCNTLRDLYELEEGSRTKLSPGILDGWIQFFLDSEIVQKKAASIQSSVLFTEFCEYMRKVARFSESEQLFKPLLDSISIQAFSKTMKDIHGIKTQRKAAGVFYLDIDYAKNGAGQGLTDAIAGADFADLHREAKTESNWASY